MPEAWTGDIVKKMHLNQIKSKDLADEAGFEAAYVSMILNGKRSPVGAREKLEAALDAIIQRKEKSA